MTDNKRIAKNTIMLWIRMLISIFVSLYTSRIVLNTLGVEDYGVYSVVGGILSIFSYVKTSTAGAISRFFIYEMGREDTNQLKITFSSAFMIQLGLALAIVILGETIGLWFIENKLVIPENRLFAAHVVYQFSIISTAIGFIMVPYDATIIAHERMDLYAYMELLNVTLKLVIVYLLMILTFDKLILYSVLLFIVSCLITLIYQIYTYRHYQETHIQWKWNFNIVKSMLTFSGWDMYNHTAVSVRTQGFNFLQNIFFGAKVNAAIGIATTIQGTLLGLAYNVITAFRPPIIKCYASDNNKEMLDLISFCLKISLAILLVLSLPLFAEIEYILTLWLGIVPEYTVEFMRLIIIGNVFGMINSIIIIPIHASGNINQMAFWTGTLYLASLIPTYLLFKNDYSPLSAYYIYLATMILILIMDYFILKYKTKINGIGDILLKNILFNTSIASCIWYILLLIQKNINTSFMRLLICCVLSAMLYSFFFYFIMLNTQQRLSLQAKFKSIINK